MMTKEEYVEKLKNQLDEWKVDLDNLRAKAADAADDVRESIEKEIAEIKLKWDEGEGKRQEMIDSADEKWDELKEDAEEGWAHLTGFVKDSLDRIKSKFS
ncbi:hypothetical protein [Thiocystis violascens]|uniref:Coiled coil domain-containing protein n=1 Tax=Thiocystis violascens (strain ATCC 17096 / DSM 198 / 6111) TaxID=765911 RepID=I3YAW2_THIV6|nr:hypothetical protein [Thiocystis violascens]AFL74130.1 hypothetical protein Thivi_2180 [Thiocystis violascens DSM 198]